MKRQITFFINALSKRARVVISTSLLVMISIGALNAQDVGKLSGTIKDELTGEPLVGANIVVVGTSLGAASGIDGSYFVLNITPGKYDLQVSMLGYQKIIQKNTIVNSGKTTIANFSMTSSSLQLGTVVIQATRPDVEKEKTSTSSIIRTEDVQNLAGIRTVGDVLGLAADVTDGHFRGGRDGEEYYTLQGMGIINPLNSSSAFLPIMSAVEEVEVVTSGFGAQYGNAQSGVVNITMKEGKPDKWRATADVRSRAPGRKHFGPSVFDPNYNPALALLNGSDSAWKSSDQNNQGYFGSYGLSNIFGGDTLAQLMAARTIWRYQTKRDLNKNYGTDIDQSVEFTLGGPVNEKMRMFLAFRNDVTWPTFPTEQPDKQRQLMGNLLYDVGEGSTLRLSGGYALENTNIFPSQNSLGFYTWMWDRILSINYRKNENIQLGLRFSKALDKSTYYEIKLNSLITNNTVGSAPAPSWVADSLIYPTNKIDWDKVLIGAASSPDLFYYLRGDDQFKNEKTRTYSFEGSMTSQVTKSHLLNGGLQFNYYTIDVKNASSTQTGSGGAVSIYSANPYEGALYIQDKMEFEGMIANVGLRFDVWSSNLNYYTNLFMPYSLIIDTVIKSVRYDALSAPKAKSPVIARLQPRVGVSFPVSEFTVFHANYGSFMQRPSFQYVVGSTVQQGINKPQTLGNPRLEPQTTNSYDVGIMQGLVAGFTLDVSGYYKDVKNLVEAADFTSNTGLTYTSYYNRDNADIRGFRIALTKRSGIISGSINYQYSVATGKSATADFAPPSFRQDSVGNVTTVNDKVPLKDVLLGFDRTHNLTVNLTIDSDELLHALGSDINLGIYLSLNMFARSGRPYTSPSNPKLINGSRSPAEYNTNLRLTKRVFNFLGFQSATIYFEVFNLFNDKILNYDYIFATPNALAVSTVTQLYEGDDNRNNENVEKGIERIKYWNANNVAIPQFRVDQSFLIFSNQPRSFNLGISFEL
jgi:outer membrane receptor protein involved in Fe transport